MFIRYINIFNVLCLYIVYDILYIVYDILFSVYCMFNIYMFTHFLKEILYKYYTLCEELSSLRDN